MRKGVVLLSVIFASITPDVIHGRLTEITTDRLPVLSQNLHKTNIDLNAISRRASLGLHSKFRLKNGDFIQTSKGSQRVRLTQIYAGYEVHGPTAVAELNMEGHFTGHVYGEVAKDLDKDIPNPGACVRDVKVLINRVIRLENLKPTDPNIERKAGRRAIYADSNKRRAKIIYIVEFLYKGDNFVSYPVYYMDACLNSVMFSYNKIRNFSLPETRNISKTMESNEMRALRNVSSRSFLQFVTKRIREKVGTPCFSSVVGVGGNSNTGQIFYNTQPYCLPAKVDGFTCTMDGTYATIIDNENSDDMNKKTPISFDCTVGYSDPVNGAFGVANDALFYSELTGQFFTEIFNLKALPSKPRIVVHFKTNYENAFSNGLDMFYGDGKDNYYPFVYLDIVAHEYAHGITTANSDLIYFGMPGGINEAFSDITAAAVYFYAFETTSWELGSVINKEGTPIRYMDDPPKDGSSIKNAWRFHPFMNVHHSSGVFNYAFYHMVRTYNIDINVAYAAFLNANRLLWGKFTRFRRGACNVIQAAYDTGADYRTMRNAFVKTWLFLFACRYRALKTTLFPGEMREGIFVSRHRSPILEIDMTHWPGSGVDASTSASVNHCSTVRIVVATDGDADHVIAKGENNVKFPANYTKVHVKLMTHCSEGINVTLKVLT